MRRLRFMGHPIHPMVTDFPIALLPLALLWQILAWIQDDGFWWKAGFWTLVAGLVAAVPAAASGFVEYLQLDTKGAAFQRATTHMLIMLTAVLLFGGSAIAQRGSTTVPEGRGLVIIGLGVLGSICLGVGGWYGGELVFGHGAGMDQAAAPEPGHDVAREGSLVKQAD